MRADEDSDGLFSVLIVLIVRVSSKRGGIVFDSDPFRRGLEEIMLSMLREVDAKRVALCEDPVGV